MHRKYEHRIRSAYYTNDELLSSTKSEQSTITK